MSHRLLRRAPIYLLVVALAAVSGCAASAFTQGHAVPTHGNFTINAPPRLPYVRVVSQTQIFSFHPDSQGVEGDYMTEACAPGEIAISGGFQFVQGTDAAPIILPYPFTGITESYPSAGGWRITFVHKDAVQVTIYADCLGNANASVTMLSTDFDAPANQESPWEQTACPTGSMAIGGGFSVRYPIAVLGSRAYTSSDGTSGWSGQFINGSSSDYINAEAVWTVCYGAQRPEQAAPFNPAQTVTTFSQYTIYGSRSESTSTVTFTASCPEGWTRTAGLFSGVSAVQGDDVDTNAPDVLFPNGHDLQWQLELVTINQPADLSTLGFSVECVQFS